MQPLENAMNKISLIALLLKNQVFLQQDRPPSQVVKALCILATQSLVSDQLRDLGITTA
jgi:hypothetical protein